MDKNWKEMTEICDSNFFNEHFEKWKITYYEESLIKIKLFFFVGLISKKFENLLAFC